MPLTSPKIKSVGTILRRGGVGILPTDTIYGIVGSAFDEKAVRRIYALRKRNPKKPSIILISVLEELELFGIVVHPHIKKSLKRVWPGKVSVVFEIQGGASHSKKLKYLHRGTKTLAFRLPRPKWLRELLLVSGPIIAPSANFEGEPPAKNIREAKKYFVESVDFYMNLGRLDSKPSTVAKLERGRFIVLRQGARKIK